MACSKLVKIFLFKIQVMFFLLKLTNDYKEIFFLFYVAKSISFERFKNKHFCGQIDNFMTSIAIFNLELDT